jgi:uncharacterized protein
MLRYFILPGWQNSGPDHWQSLWEAELSRAGYAERVIQHDWMRPLRGDWITKLEDQILSINERLPQGGRALEAKNAFKNTFKNEFSNDQKDIILIAHSLGCHLVSAWAALSKNTHRIKGALLVAPPDGTREDFPQELKSWRPPVLQKLPFPSICVISANDPFCDQQSGKEMAAAWCSQLIELGNAGHINAESGLGHWPQGRALLAKLGR